jgi:beta-aspartyl-peptidase (threonine type)
VAKISLAIHGGAGTILKSKITPEKEKEYFNALETVLREAYSILRNGSSCVDVVEHAVSMLEDSPLFNAGRGSVFCANGMHEMDASIMEGNQRMAGAVAAVQGIKNPIGLARLVMEKSEHVFLAGQGAEKFAREHDIRLENNAYFHDEFRFQQWQKMRGTDKFSLDHTDLSDEKFGTVGAVALDQDGNIAAATSTGGMTNKKYGRIGDSPVIGSGTYANNDTCAVSCTGSGEFFLRGVTAYDLSCLMEYKGLSLQDASNEVIKKRLIALGGDGGLIAVDKHGNIVMPFNTEGMYRACVDKEGNSEIAIYK